MKIRAGYTWINGLVYKVIYCQARKDTKLDNTRESNKFCNILVCTNLQPIYRMTDAVQANKRHPYGW